MVVLGIISVLQDTLTQYPDESITPDIERLLSWVLYDLLRFEMCVEKIFQREKERNEVENIMYILSEREI